MQHKLWAGLVFAAALTACSDDNTSSLPDQAGEASHTSVPLDKPDQASPGAELDLDCPGFEALFALLPDQLEGEAISEQYFSCDAVTPTASSHFTSQDQLSYWTFSITARDLQSAAAQPRWDLADADESQRDYLKAGIKATLDLQAQLYDNCINNTPLAGSPGWNTTSTLDIGGRNVCIGTDAQMIDAGGWKARAISEQYLYLVHIEGEHATQFDSAQAATAYLENLFRQFK